MRRLSWHVGSTIFGAIAVAMIVLVGLDAVGALIDETGDIRANYRFIDALIYVVTYLPSRMYEYTPFAALIGCLVGLGLLAGNSEIIVMRAAGVSPSRIVGFVLRPVMLVIAVVMAVGEYFSPYLDQLAEGRREYLIKGEQAADSTSGLWSREGNEFLHFNAVFPGGVLYGVSRYAFDDDKKIVSASFASRATFNVREKYWTEENVSITRFLEDKTETEKQVTRRWDSELTPVVLSLHVLPEDSLPISILYNYIHFLKQQGADTVGYEVAFWRKVLQPLVILGLVVLGISSVFGPLRDATMGFRIFIGVIVGVSFRMIQDVLGPLSVVFEFPPLLAVMLPIVFCFVVGIYLLRRSG